MLYLRSSKSTSSARVGKTLRKACLFSSFCNLTATILDKNEKTCFESKHAKQGRRRMKGEVYFLSFVIVELKFRQIIQTGLQGQCPVMDILCLTMKWSLDPHKRTLGRSLQRVSCLIVIGIQVSRPGWIIDHWHIQDGCLLHRNEQRAAFISKYPEDFATFSLYNTPVIFTPARYMSSGANQLGTVRGSTCRLWFFFDSSIINAIG